MTTKGHPLIGKWRITSMELWDAAFIDLLGPGYIRFDADGGGEFVFGAVQGGSTATSASIACRTRVQTGAEPTSAGTVMMLMVGLNALLEFVSAEMQIISWSLRGKQSHH